MPAMKRLKGKATKIAYAILGKPANMQYTRRSVEETRVNNRLVFEETQRVR